MDQPERLVGRPVRFCEQRRGIVEVRVGWEQLPVNVHDVAKANTPKHHIIASAMSFDMPTFARAGVRSFHPHIRGACRAR